MPANTYPKQDYPVSTVGLVLFWGTTTRLPNEVAYEICKIVHQHYKEGVEMFKPFGQFSELFKDFGSLIIQGQRSIGGRLVGSNRKR